MLKEPIAIIGMGCRFPGARNLSQFWELLCSKKNAIGPVPDDRPTGQKGLEGYLEGIDRFDAGFFRISPEEARTIDPQYRFLLEVTWSALEDAGLIPEKLRGSRTSVFTGVSHSDYYKLMSQRENLFEFASLVGNHPCMAANFISYHFDFRSASLTVNTACSSGLAVVDLACQSLWNREASLALASAVNMNLCPLVGEAFASAGLIAADGRCKSFDARADGYIRSEGVGVVVLKPLFQAQADNDKIYAVIRGTKINHNGRGNGLTVPNKQAQIQLLQEVYQESGIAPQEVHYIEAHGTGTPIGDILEMKALGEVFGSDRRLGDLCRIGCVKTNIGHTEATAGIAGLIKVALSLHKRHLPPNLHYDQHHPQISPQKLGLKIQRELEALSEEVGVLRAGVSAFGFGGTNAHVILESAPAVTDRGYESPPIQILTLTAKTEGGLQELVKRYRAFLDTDPDVSLEEICFTANTKRSQFKHRLAFVTESKEGLKNQLDAYLLDETARNPFISQVTSKERVLIGFILSGKPYKFKEVLRFYYNECEDFRSYLKDNDKIFALYGEKLLSKIIDGSGSEVSLEAEAVNFLLEYAGVQLWKYWGIDPAIVTGYGVGQYTAATSAGMLTAEDALDSIVNRRNFKIITESTKAKVSSLSPTTGRTFRTNEIIFLEQDQTELKQDTLEPSDSEKTLSNYPYICVDIDNCCLKGEGEEEEEYPNIKSLKLIFSTLIRLWLKGAEVAWDKVGNYQGYHPIYLPDYAFEGQSYWLDSSVSETLNHVVSKVSKTVESEEKKEKAVIVTTTRDKESLLQKLPISLQQIEDSLLNIWADVLKIEKIGIHDNFFELGGDSRAALALVAGIQKTFRCKLPGATLFQAVTIAELAKIVNQQNYQEICKSLLIIKQGNSQSPIFFIHVLGRGLKFCLPLAKHLDLERPIYGLSAQLIDKTLAPSNDVQELADYYVREMRTIQPDGPYFLAGISFGGLVAYEMARKLQAQNQEVAFLGLIDAITAQGVRKLPSSERLKIHLQNLSQLGFTYLEKKLLGKVKGTILKIKRIYNFFVKSTYYDLAPKLGVSIPTDVEDLILANENYQALLKYMPGNYSGKVILFYAMEKNTGVSYQLDPTLGWGQVALGSLEIKEIPGTHLGILEEPNVRFLAQQIKAEIDKAMENYQGSS